MEFHSCCAGQYGDKHIPGIYLTFGTWPTRSRTYMSKIIFTVQSSSSIPVVQANTVQCDEHIPGIYLTFSTWPTRSRTCLETSSLFSRRVPFRLCRPVWWWTHSWYLFIFYLVQDLPDQEHICPKSSSLFNHRVPFLLCRPIRSNVMNTFLALLSTLRSDYSIDQQTVVACPSQVAPSSVGFLKLPYGGGGMTLIIPNFLVVLFRG